MYKIFTIISYFLVEIEKMLDDDTKDLKSYSLIEIDWPCMGNIKI